MRGVFMIGIVLAIGKFIAYFYTNSNAILSDALESIINIVAGGMATWGVSIAAKPKDIDHPYGHGKIEFISAGAEGGLIVLAGLFIIYKAIVGLWYSHPLNSLDIGLVITAGAGLANFAMGTVLINEGRKYKSAILVADGKHLLSDTVSSVGVVAGLLLSYLTGYTWIDGITAILFAIYILFTGYKLVQEAMGTLLDKADNEKLTEIVELLNRKRRERWIDIHNLRTQKYGSDLHVDCHITLPWYDTLEQSHEEVDYLREIVQDSMTHEVEFFVHADPCVPPKSCSVCILADCPKRQAPFVKRIHWNLDNVLPNHKHSAIEEE